MFLIYSNLYSRQFFLCMQIIPLVFLHLLLLLRWHCLHCVCVYLWVFAGFVRVFPFDTPHYMHGCICRTYDRNDDGGQSLCCLVFCAQSSFCGCTFVLLPADSLAGLFAAVRRVHRRFNANTHTHRHISRTRISAHCPCSIHVLTLVYVVSNLLFPGRLRHRRHGFVFLVRIA